MVSEERETKSIQIFISHSSKDSELARALIQLLRAAFNMSAGAIRCTSLDGYRLPIGLSVSERLQAEVYESKALIALVTPSSLASSYFLFELGVRWGAKLPLYPLFAGGASARDVNDWLRDINALNCNSEGQLLQLAADLRDRLELESENADSYLQFVKELVAASKQAESKYIEWHGQLDPKEQQRQQAEMKTEDSDLGEHYSTFWNLAHKFYIETYRPKGNPDFPDTLEGLIQAAEAPQNTINVQLISWPSINEGRLRQDQRRIWNFAKSIYPARHSEAGDVWEYSAIKPVEDAKRFHDARRALAKYWDKWPPLVGFDFIRERYTTRREIILLLAWLELALVQWTRMGGMHKQELFKLALKFDDIKTSAQQLHAADAVNRVADA